MVERGFSLGKGRFQYFRQVEDAFHFLLFGGSIDPTIRRVHVFFWLPEFEPEYDPAKFPSNVSRIGLGGRLSEGSVGIGGSTWKFSNGTEAERSFAEILPLIDRIVIPWFTQLGDRAQVLRAWQIVWRLGVSGHEPAKLLRSRA